MRLSPEQISRCMEGIVRQTWRALPQCDICFVYTLTQAHSAAMLDGKFQRSASAMEKVADHYGIPTIHMAILAKNGNKIEKPERFAGTALYPGAILFVGEIVK